MKFRKKPIEIEAIQWVGNNAREMFNFLTDSVDKPMDTFGDRFYIEHVKVKGGLVIKTLEGEHLANLDDWIIKGIAGEFYPCKPSIFEDTYDIVENETA